MQQNNSLNGEALQGSNTLQNDKSNLQQQSATNQSASNGQPQQNVLGPEAYNQFESLKVVPSGVPTNTVVKKSISGLGIIVLIVCAALVTVVLAILKRRKKAVTPPVAVDESPTQELEAVSVQAEQTKTVKKKKSKKPSTKATKKKPAAARKKKR